METSRGSWLLPCVCTRNLRGDRHTLNSSTFSPHFHIRVCLNYQKTTLENGSILLQRRLDPVGAEQRSLESRVRGFDVVFGAGLSEPSKCDRFIPQLLSGFEVLMFHLYLSQYGSSLLKYVGKKGEPASPKGKDGETSRPGSCCLFSKPARALKDEIHFVSSCAPGLPDEGSGGEEEERERGGGDKEGEMEGGICLICQKFLN